MEIAPQDDDLVVSAQVSPNDIDSIALGQTAEVRLTTSASTNPSNLWFRYIGIGRPIDGSKGSGAIFSLD